MLLQSLISYGSAHFEGLVAGDPSSAWFALGGALGGVLITGMIALVTAVLNHRWQAETADRTLDWEHARQIREERREVYAAYRAAWNALTWELLQPEGHARPAEIAWRQAFDVCRFRIHRVALDLRL